MMPCGRVDGKKVKEEGNEGRRKGGRKGGGAEERKEIRESGREAGADCHSDGDVANETNFQSLLAFLESFI